MTTWPPNDSRWIAPVGQPIMQTGSAQCMQALAIMQPAGDSARGAEERGLLSCVEAQARTQSSQRVQRSRSITIVAVPLKKRFSVRNSSARCRAPARARACGAFRAWSAALGGLVFGGWSLAGGAAGPSGNCRGMTRKAQHLLAQAGVRGQILDHSCRNARAHRRSRWRSVVCRGTGVSAVKLWTSSSRPYI